MRCATVALLGLLLAGCGSVTPATPTAEPTPESLPPIGLGAGFRYSTYGIGRNDPGLEYWLGVGIEMAVPFEGATPQAVWIVAEIAGPGTVLTFPGSSDDVNIHFRSEDNNEAALDAFDEAGVKVWLQLEPGNATVSDLIDIVLERYGYFVDRPWWVELDDLPADIGRALLDAVPNTAGLLWVDFTVFEIFEPPE